MTEPREPETNLDEGESTRPIEPQPGAASWYPVDPPRTEAASPEASQEAPEPNVDEPSVDEPSVDEPSVDEPSVDEPSVDEPSVDEPVGLEPPAEAPAAEEPLAEAPAVAVPEPEPVPENRWAEEPAAETPPAVAVASEEPAADRPFVSEPIVPEPVAEAPAIEEPPASDTAETADVAASEPTRTLFGDAEPTVATDAPVEETVALESEPMGYESTSVLPQAVAVQPTPPPPLTPPATGPTESIFRQPSPSSGPEFEPTRVEQPSDEEQKLAAERAARREARTTALAATSPVPVVAPDPVIVHKRTNDKFWGSVGLFLLRLVLAAILAVRGLNLLTDIPAAQAMFAKTIIPAPGIMAIVTGVAALLIALSLILGLLTRLAGLGIALIGAGALVFVYWGNWSPFVAGRPGFLGDYELLLAAVGILLLCIGAGGWSLDRSIRSGRERNKAERASEGA